MATLSTTRRLTADELEPLLRPRRGAMVVEVADEPPGPRTDPAADIGGTANYGSRDRTDAVPGSAAATTGEMSAAFTVAFTAVDGPFEEYRRTVSAKPVGSDGRAEVTERTRYRLAIPFWSWLYHFPVRRVMLRNVPEGQSLWWAPPDRFDRRSANVLGLAASMGFVAGVLSALPTQTLAYAAEDLGIGGSAAQANVFSVLRVGIVVTVIAGALADRRGRRTLLLWCGVTGGLLAMATAAVPDAVSYTVLQALCRNLGLAVGSLALIVAAEEVPAGSRAYAAAITSMATGVGVGSVVFLIPLADAFDGGWRVVHVLAGVTVPLAVLIHRRLPETRRFEAQVVRHEGPVHHLRGERLALLAVSGLLLNVLVGPGSQLQNEFLKESRGFSGAAVALFIFLTNGPPGAVGIVVGGRLSDRYGRRPIAAIGLSGYALLSVAMYSSSGPALWAFSLFGALIGGLIVPSLGVFGPELFPTERRGGSNGLLAAAGVIGSVVGLQIVGRLVDSWGTFGAPFAVVAVGPLLVAVLVLARFPETAHRELEDLNP